MELLALGIVLFYVNNCCFRREFSNEVSLCPTKASGRLSFQISTCRGIVLGVCIFLQNLAETKHVKQATLALRSVVIKG